jgi:hypothetical protein
MTSEFHRLRAGLRLPMDFIQPFLLRFRREDLHIMAFFDGHPDYEAVEAMIKYRDGESPSIRAILTRHDQTQIDHVNDEALVAEGRSVVRQTCHRAISLGTDALPGKRHARLEFVSHAGEPIVLDITTTGEPDPKRSGISDPGAHSPTTSLPLMRRAASTLAGPQTTVTIGGRSFDVPVKIRSGPFVAHEGYYTEGHTFAAIRAGTMTCRLKARPNRIGIGAEWVFEGEGRDLVYRVVECAADGQLLIAGPDDGGELITAAMVGEQLAITRVSRTEQDGPQGGFDLTFDAGRFDLSIDGEAIVTGTAEMTGDAEAAVITLRPAQPDWAVTRQVRVVCSRNGDLVTAATTIGAGPSTP